MTRSARTWGIGLVGLRMEGVFGMDIGKLGRHVDGRLIQLGATEGDAWSKLSNILHIKPKHCHQEEPHGAS